MGSGTRRERQRADAAERSHRIRVLSTLRQGPDAAAI